MKMVVLVMGAISVKSHLHQATVGLMAMTAQVTTKSRTNHKAQAVMSWLLLHHAHLKLVAPVMGVVSVKFHLHQA